MALVYPLDNNIIREYDSTTKKNSFNINQLISQKSVPNASKSSTNKFQKKVSNANSHSASKTKSADTFLEEKKNSVKSKKRDRAKRPQTITYVEEEAEHVFEAFCSRNKGRSSSAPNSFSKKIDRNISENKMKMLTDIIKKSSDSEREMENQLVLKERKKKTFFKRIKERIMALNNKEPLLVRSEREREREKEREKEKDDKRKFTQKIFESFRKKRNKKKFKSTLNKKDSDTYTNQSTDGPLDRSGNSVFSDLTPPRNQGREDNRRLDQVDGNLDIPTVSPSSYPFSPSGLQQNGTFFPEVVQITAEERRKMDRFMDGGASNAPPAPSSPPPPLFPPSNSSVRGSPYLAFFDSLPIGGSSVDRKMGLSKSEGFSAMRFIDDDDDAFNNNNLRPTGSSSGANARGFGKGQSSVDSHQVSLSSLEDSGCEDVNDKYTQVANHLEKISQEVNTEIKEIFSDSTQSWVRDLASQSSYNSFQVQLNDLLNQLNEPLLYKVAMLFSLTRNAINLVGMNSRNASRLKDFLLRYYTSYFALKVASEGGLESLTEDSDN